MAVRLRFSVATSISSTTAEEKDLGQSSFEVVSDAQGEGGNWKLTLPAGSADVQLQLGNISSLAFLAIRTNAKNPLDDPAAITLKKDSASGEPITIAPLPDTKEGHLLLTTTGITALYLSNSGTVDMEVTVAASGD